MKTLNCMEGSPLPDVFVFCPWESLILRNATLNLISVGNKGVVTLRSFVLGMPCYA